MTTTQVIEIIQKQIDAVSPILERLAYLKAMPSGMKAGGNQAMAEVCYSSASISDFEEKGLESDLLGALRNDGYIIL